LPQLNPLQRRSSLLKIHPQEIMKSTTIALIICSPIFLASCENPADKTSAAVVSEAVENSVVVSEGGTRFVFTPESTVNFIGSKVTGSHEGGFKTVTGHFTVKDGALVGNDHSVIIDMNSIWSDSEKLTTHLKNEDFFEVDTYPEALFVATSLVKSTDTEYEVSGNFTLHGVTKNITFPATAVEADGKVKINSTFNINRKDFDIIYSGMSDNAIRDEVVISLALEAQPGS
jgi:polyisoprenoid-binding protein YceI